MAIKGILRNNQMTALGNKGALANKPRFQLATDPGQLATQGQQLQNRINAKGGLANAPKLAARLNQVQNAQQGLQNEYGFNQTIGAGNQQMQNLFTQMGQQQPLSTDYSALRQRAEQNAMDSFNRNMNPQFQQEDAAFRQRMAEQGIDPNSQGAQQQYKQMMQSQNLQRQNAIP